MGRNQCVYWERQWEKNDVKSYKSIYLIILSQVTVN